MEVIEPLLANLMAQGDAQCHPERSRRLQHCLPNVILSVAEGFCPLLFAPHICGSEKEEARQHSSAIQRNAFNYD